MHLRRREFLAAGLGLLLQGCTGSVASHGIRGAQAWGGQGLRDGYFLKPRAIGVYAAEVYVIDTTGRVQVFDESGRFRRLWSMPDARNGTPTAVAFTKAGTVLIPDTHYHAIREYSTAGGLLREWGEYGSGPGRFIYPTGIVELEDGCFAVSEYGQNAERIQIFDPDGRFLRQWGSHGDAPGQFNRAMAVTRAGSELFVADTANHRIQVFTAQGDHLRTISGPGREPGRLDFPYDVAAGPDGTIFAAEYGAHRISRFTREGMLIATYGRAGRGPGAFDGPRGVAVSPECAVFVADTDNHRVQRFAVEAVA